MFKKLITYKFIVATFLLNFSFLDAAFSSSNEDIGSLGEEDDSATVASAQSSSRSSATITVASTYSASSSSGWIWQVVPVSSSSSSSGGGGGGGRSSGSSSSASDKYEDYADPKYDIAFKHLLSLGKQPEIAKEFVNLIVPDFFQDPIIKLQELPLSIPALPQPVKTQIHMDVHFLATTHSGKQSHVLLEMQQERHPMFDERSLGYAAAVYHSQVEEKEADGMEWYKKLMPVYAVQILNYDSNRVLRSGGIKSDVTDTLVERVKDKLLKRRKFKKHYKLTDVETGQTIDSLQIIQFELKRVTKKMLPFPPTHSFEPLDWWLSLFRHSSKYTLKEIEANRDHIPETIQKALLRLRLEPAGVKKQYQKDVSKRQKHTAELQAAKEEGIKEGRRQAEKKINKRIVKRGLEIGDTDEEMSRRYEIPMPQVKILRQEVIKDSKVKSNAPAKKTEDSDSY